MKAFNNTNKAAQSPVMYAWEYEQQKKNDNKANKSLRSLRKGKKMQWQSES